MLFYIISYLIDKTSTEATLTETKSHQPTKPPLGTAPACWVLSTLSRPDHLLELVFQSWNGIIAQEAVTPGQDPSSGALKRLRPQPPEPCRGGNWAWRP